MADVFPAPDHLSERECILFYAECGLPYKQISKLLDKYHGILLSENAIGKRLKKHGQPCRRGTVSLNEADLQSIIMEKLKLLPGTVGYRQLSAILKNEGHVVRRDTVMKLLRNVDPIGTQVRRTRCFLRRTYSSKGPNQTWHIDGYDKLKRYGFPIHGCIDGYSRRIMWLEVGPSNNDPKQMVFHFMKCVECLKGCPSTIQADRGTENTVIGALQCTFREKAPGYGREDSFQHVSSQLNQRIEAWWSFLRKRCIQWWMDFFMDLVNSGAYASNDPRALKILRYEFIPVIQKDLDAVAQTWNSHLIRFCRKTECPNGIPNVLFSLPEETGGTDHLHCIDTEVIDFGFTQTRIPSITGDYDFDEMVRNESARLRLLEPSTWQDALQNFYKLYENM